MPTVCLKVTKGGHSHSKSHLYVPLVIKEFSMRTRGLLPSRVGVLVERVSPKESRLLGLTFKRAAHYQVSAYQSEPKFQWHYIMMICWAQLNPLHPDRMLVLV